MRARRLLFAVLLGLAACNTSQAPAPSTPPLRFLLINDVYFGDSVRDGTAGLARVAAIHDSLERTGPVTFVLAGDFLSPSLLSKWYRGEQMRQELNAARLDRATFGNHEFEIDRDTLISRIANSRFKWTSANCMMADGNPFPGVSKWDTSTISGVKVGVFGVTIVGDYRRYVKCNDADSSAHVAIAALKAQGAQMIYGLTHQNKEADSLLMLREPDVTFILGGHEHDGHRILIGDRRLLKAEANSRTAQLLTLTRTANGWQQSDELIRVDKRFPFENATQLVVSGWNDSIAKKLGPEKVVATTKFPIDGRDVINRAQESPLGDVVTDAMRLGTGADAAVMNSGTMRIDDVIAAGPITNYQLESIFLFSDETRILKFPISGAHLRTILEHGVADGSVGKGPYLQVSGLVYTWDHTRPSGSRIIGDVKKTDGTVIDPNDMIQLALNVYPACEGGDGYVVPEAKTACDSRNLAPRAVDLVLRHMTQDLGGTVPPPPAGRVTRR